MNPRIKHIFFIVGAQRSGTTYLYHMLDAHPEICMAKPIWPESKHFLSENAADHLAAYEEKHFCHADRSARIFGEKSTSYYQYEDAAARIIKAYPESRIIFLLRNPTDRAISNYRFSVMNKLETRSLHDVFIEEKPPPNYSPHISADPFQYIDRSDYLRFIQIYHQYFDPSKVLILILEHLVNNAAAVQEAYRFLGVDEGFIPPHLNKRINPSEDNDLVVDEAITQKLSRLFKGKIEELERFLSIDLSVWKRP